MHSGQPKYQKGAPLSKAPDPEQQEHDDHGGEREAVVGEDAQGVAGQVAEQEPYRQVPDDPGG